MRRRIFVPWLAHRPLLLEAFATMNLAFLAADIYVAHSMNAFRHPAEWIPFYFSLAGALALAANLWASRPWEGGRRAFHTGAGRWIGLAVGWSSIAVGVAGLVWHLESQFFRLLTLKSLVYSAPFIAPLAYTGVGLLVLVNRIVTHGTREWGRWVIVLAWAGFVGNFGLALLDHAQNGFFYWTEWIAVGVSAFAVGFVLLPAVTEPTREIAVAVTAVLVAQAATGFLGLAFHLRPLFSPSNATLVDRVVHGAPVFAPLLFVNLALLAAIGLADLWGMARKTGPARVHARAGS